MNSKTIRLLIASLVALVAIVFVAGRRAVPDASADSLRSDAVELVRVFENQKFSNPVWMEQPPHTSKRWYLIEQRGRIVTFANNPDGSKRSIALDITDRVDYGGEKGLLGLAFHPKFPTDPRLFVNYTSSQDGDLRTRVSVFKVKADGVSFDAGTEKVLLNVGQPYSNHNGGQIGFGPDGMLYIALGDGGLAGDPKGHGQDTSTLLGGFARIDIDVKEPYGIPADNPFAKGGGAPELYAWGLRNPWRFSFDRKTGKLWTGDVGQNAWEEISVIEKGKNYGWNIREGTRCYDPPVHLKPLGKGDCGEAVKLEPPVTEYSQKRGDRSVTGGYVYRGKRSPSLVGKYIYGDFVSGRIWAFDPKTKSDKLLVDTGVLIASFAEGRDGEIGVIGYGGSIYHIVER